MADGEADDILLYKREEAKTKYEYLLSAERTSNDNDNKSESNANAPESFDSIVNELDPDSTLHPFKHQKAKHEFLSS